MNFSAFFWVQTRTGWVAQLSYLGDYQLVGELNLRTNVSGLQAEENSHQTGRQKVYRELK